MNAWVFEARRDGTYSARLRAAEREVLADVVGQVVELLGGDRDGAVGGDRDGAVGGHPLDRVRLGVGPIPVPTDPAVHRLLPDASRDDAEIAAEFRRLTEEDLRSTKVGNLVRLRTLLLGGPVDRVVVPPDEAAAVAAAMTDLRLVVAERLGVRTEEDADEVHRLATEPGPEATEPDLARRLLAVLSVMLGVLQDSLVELMLEAMPDEGAGARDPDDGPDPDDGLDPDDGPDPDDGLDPDDGPPEPRRAPR